MTTFFADFECNQNTTYNQILKRNLLFLSQRACRIRNRDMKTFTLYLLLGFQSAYGQTMTLQEYLKKAAEQNIDLKIDQSRADSISAKAVGLAIPPPMVGLIQMKEQQGTSANGFEISQTIPFPTKLSGDHSARKYEAMSQEENRLSSKKQTLLRAKILYISLWQDQERTELLEQKWNFLQDHIKLSRSTVRSDSFAATHLLKAESDFDFLENDIESSKQNIREKQIQIALFIGADPSSFKAVAIEPVITPLPIITSLEDSHQFRSLNLNLESLKVREFEAKSSWLPDFNFRYKEMGATSMSTRYNESMVGITLPFLFFWEPNSTSKQAHAARLIGEYNLEKQRRSFNSIKMTLLSRAESLKKQIETLNTKLIPRAEKRMRLVHNLAPRDMETLQDHRETMEAFPDLKMKALNLRMQYEESVAELEKFTTDKDLQNE